MLKTYSPLPQVSITIIMIYIIILAGIQFMCMHNESGNYNLKCCFNNNDNLVRILKNKGNDSSIFYNEIVTKCRHNSRSVVFKLGSG